MKRIRVIFSDIDGTVLSSGHRLSPESLGALKSLKKRGFHFIPVTARTALEVEFFCRINETCSVGGMAPWGVVEMGGGVVKPSENCDAEGSALGHLQVVPVGARLHTFYQYVSLVMQMVCRSGYYLIPELGSPLPKTRLDYSWADAQLLYSRLFDLLVIAPGKCASSVERALREKGMDVYAGARFMHTGVGLKKERGLRILIDLLEKCGYAIEETVCMGDSAVDLGFIRTCDRGFLVNYRGNELGVTVLSSPPERALPALLELIE